MMLLISILKITNVIRVLDSIFLIIFVIIHKRNLSAYYPANGFILELDADSLQQLSATVLGRRIIPLGVGAGAADPTLHFAAEPSNLTGTILIGAVRANPF